MFSMSLREVAKYAVRVHGIDASIVIDEVSFKIIDNQTKEVLVKLDFDGSYVYYFVDPIPFTKTEYMVEGIDFEAEECPLLDKQFELYQKDKSLPKCVHIQGYTIIVEEK